MHCQTATARAGKRSNQNGRPALLLVLHSSNQLLQALLPADFELLRAHLQICELVREAVLVEAGAPLTHVYLPQSGVISSRNSFPDGQTVEVAMVGPDGIFGAACNASHWVAARLALAVACARSDQHRNTATDAGSPGADDRCAAQRACRPSPMRCRRPEFFATAAVTSRSPTRKHYERRLANATRQSGRSTTGCSGRPIDDPATNRGCRDPHDSAHWSGPEAERHGVIPILLANQAPAAYALLAGDLA